VAARDSAADKALLPLEIQNTYRERYRALHPGWRSSGERFDALVQSYLTPRTNVMDLGCGRGGAIELFWRDVNLAAGLDPDAASLLEHRAPGISLVRGRAEELPFTDGSFDLVVCVWVLEHLRDPATVLRGVRRALRPGGHFIFLTPNLRHPLLMLNRLGTSWPALQRRLVTRLYGRFEADTFRVRYRANTARSLRALAARCGLEVAQLTVVPDPTYLAFNGLMFRASVMSERLLPRGWGVHLLGDLQRA